MENLLERMVKKLFPNGETLDSGEFRNRAATRFHFGKRDSKVLKSEMAKAKLIDFEGPGKCRIFPSSPLYRTSILKDEVIIFKEKFERQNSIKDGRR